MPLFWSALLVSTQLEWRLCMTDRLLGPGRGFWSLSPSRRTAARDGRLSPMTVRHGRSRAWKGRVGPYQCNASRAYVVWQYYVSWNEPWKWPAVAFLSHIGQGSSCWHMKEHNASFFERGWVGACLFIYLFCPLKRLVTVLEEGKERGHAFCEGGGEVCHRMCVCVEKMTAAYGVTVTRWHLRQAHLSPPPRISACEVFRAQKGLHCSLRRKTRHCNFKYNTKLFHLPIYFSFNVLCYFTAIPLGSWLLELIRVGLRGFGLD